MICLPPKVSFRTLIAFTLGLLPLTSLADKAFDSQKAQTERLEPHAQNSLGVRYANGDGVPKDLIEAAKWFSEAAEHGHAAAQFNIGVMYANGKGVKKDSAKAAFWFQKAAESGNAGRLRSMPSRDDSPEDCAHSAFIFFSSASNSSASAQLTLGVMYAFGRSVPNDPSEAARWYLKAAEQGNAIAQSSLGFMYANGHGVPKDLSEAVKWYRKAARQGIARAQCILGFIYANGDGVPKDSAIADGWFQQAAETGKLGDQRTIYTKDYDAPQKYTGAVQRFLEAAEQGNAEAQFALAQMYCEGEGVPKDSAKAVERYHKSAEQGHATAQLNLGLRYENGFGVLKNDIEAYKWYLLSGAQGIEVAKVSITQIESRITASQRAEGQRLAREFNTRSTRPSSTASSEAVSEKARPESSGTGFFITDDGYFITNQHVAGFGATVRLVTASGLIAAKVVKVDKSNDLSLLKANGVFSALPVITSSPVRLGAAAFTVGFPNVELQGFSPKLAKGEIAGLAGIQDDARPFLISAPIQPGNSGGALVDERGNVIGVVVARLSQKAALATSGAFAENVNYAVKSSYILSFLESVPEVAAKLKQPNTRARKFEDVVTAAEQAAVMVLVY
jgi:TPR repeat protein